MLRRGRSSWLAVALLALGSSGSCAPAEPAFGAARAPAPSGPSASSSPAPDRDEPRARLAVRLSPAAKPPHLDVTLALPLAWTKLEVERVELSFRDERFRREPGGHAAFVRSLDARGRESSWSGTIEAPGPELVVRYRVRLEHAAADPVMGVDEVPHRTRGGWFLNGRAFVPQLAVIAGGRQKTLDLESELELELPAGYRAVSSAAGTSPRFAAKSLAELRDAIYYTGRFAERRLSHGGAAVRLVTSDYSDADLEPLADLVRRTLTLGTRWLGELPPEQLLIAYDRAPERAGGVVGRGISLLHAEPPGASATSPIGTVVVHELAHLWNRADAWWLNEGVTRYLEVLLSHRLDGSDALAIGRSLLDVYDAYQDSAGTRPLNEATDTPAYQGGAMLAFCLDGELRSRKSSLLAVHRELRESSRAGVGLSARGFLGRLREAFPELASRTEARLAQAGPFDARECFQQAGLRITTTRYRGFTAEALAVDVLGIGGHDLSTARVFRVRADSAFRDGDLIVRVQGRAVRRMRDVDRALAAVGVGRRFRVQVLRSGATVELSLTMPALGTEARQEHFVHSLVAAPGATSWLTRD